MGYCFVHVDPLKADMSSRSRNTKIDTSYKHNYRLVPVKNAIPELADKNEELVKLADQQGTPSSYREAYEKKLASLDYYKDRKIRRDAVPGFEVVLTFTRESASQMDLEEWKKASVEWLKETFNVAPEEYGNNVVSAMFHGDEVGAPHIHAFVLPIDENGHFNYSRFSKFGMFSHYQDTYAEKMQPFGLQRGVKGSVATHQDIKKMYAEHNQRIESVPKMEKDEDVEHYAERLRTHVQETEATLAREMNEKIRRIQQDADRRVETERQASISDANAGRILIQQGIFMAENDLKSKKKQIQASEEELDEIFSEIDEAQGILGEYQQAEEDRQALSRYRGIEEEFNEITARYPYEMGEIMAAYEEIRDIYRQEKSQEEELDPVYGENEQEIWEE